MQKTVQSVAQVSLFFFLVFGALHLSAALLLAQGVSNPINKLFFYLLDLPFLFAGLTYGISRFSLNLEEIIGDLKIPLLALSCVGVLILAGAVYLNLAFPDAQLF